MACTSMTGFYQIIWLYVVVEESEFSFCIQVLVFLFTPTPPSMVQIGSLLAKLLKMQITSPPLSMPKDNLGYLQRTKCIHT